MQVDYTKLVSEIERLKQINLTSWRWICKKLEKQVNKERTAKWLKPIEVYPDYIYFIKRNGTAGHKILSLYKRMGINIDAIKKQ